MSKMSPRDRKHPRVFISYARSDAVASRLLIDHLAAAGVESHLDQTVAPGAVWQEMLKSEIETADWLIVLMSSAYFQSTWAQFELAEAFKQQKKVLPVLLENCEVPSPLNQLVWLDWTDRSQASLDQLVDVLTRST